MEKSKFTWQFGTCNYIDIYKNGIACLHVHFNDKLKVTPGWSSVYISKDDWEQVLSCIKEAKDVLKRISKI